MGRFRGFYCLCRTLTPAGRFEGSVMAVELDPVDDVDGTLMPMGYLVGLREPSPSDEEDGRGYFPPTDPVLIGEDIVCGFSHTSMDEPAVEPSTLDGRVGDEALADAVREELRADAATSALVIDVAVEDRIAYLRGTVAGIEDVESVEEVASRISQIDEVVEELILAS